MRFTMLIDVAAITLSIVGFLTDAPWTGFAVGWCIGALIGNIIVEIINDR